jgi:hypothetical protein
LTTQIKAHFLPNKYDPAWVCDEAALCGTLYRIVSITGYTEEELEQASPEFIARILYGYAGHQKAEGEGTG